MELDKRSINFKDRSIEEFKALLKSLNKYASQIKKDIPVEDEKKRIRELKLLLSELPQVKKYISKFVGPLKDDSFKPQRNKTIKIMSECLLGIITMGEAVEQKEKIALKARRNISLYKRQRNFLKIIPKDIRVFLPDTLTIDLDENGRIKAVGEVFANKTYTVAEKALSQKKLLSEYDSIKETLKSHLRSNDERIRLSSLITLIILETGIRPGRLGNKVLMEDKEEETFGATTLQRKHIRFLKNDSVQIRFLGKKGAINKALVQDLETIKALREYADKFKDHNSDYLFVYEDFSPYEYRHLKQYFENNFPNLKVTDFRKLRATEEVFNKIKEERDSLLKRIKSYTDLEAEEAEEKVIKEIVKTLQKAHESAQIALSHDSSKTTKQSYINPEVILHFLSTSDLKGSLKDCILSGKTKLDFNPSTFIEESKKVAHTHPPAYISFHKMVRLLKEI